LREGDSSGFVEKGSCSVSSGRLVKLKGVFYSEKSPTARSWRKKARRELFPGRQNKGGLRGGGDMGPTPWKRVRLGGAGIASAELEKVPRVSKKEGTS